VRFLRCDQQPGGPIHGHGFTEDLLNRSGQSASTRMRDKVPVTTAFSPAGVSLLLGQDTSNKPSPQVHRQHEQTLGSNQPYSRGGHSTLATAVTRRFPGSGCKNKKALRPQQCDFKRQPCQRLPQTPTVGGKPPDKKQRTEKKERVPAENIEITAGHTIYPGMDHKTKSAVDCCRRRSSMRIRIPFAI